MKVTVFILLVLAFALYAAKIWVSAKYLILRDKMNISQIEFFRLRSLSIATSTMSLIPFRTTNDMTQELSRVVARANMLLFLSILSFVLGIAIGILSGILEIRIS